MLKATNALSADNRRIFQVETDGISKEQLVGLGHSQIDEDEKPVYEKSVYILAQVTL